MNLLSINGNLVMNDKKQIISLFKQLKIGSRQIGVFDQCKGAWCRGRLVEFTNNGIIMHCPELNEFSTPFVFLCQLAFSFSKRFSFILPLHLTNNQVHLNFPTFLFPITKVIGYHRNNSQRQNFRVQSNEDMKTISISNPSNAQPHTLTGQLTDISAGGIGISVDMETLQFLEDTQNFLITINYHVGINKKIYKSENSDQIEIIATLRNIRDLANRRIQLGFSFEIEHNSHIDFRAATQKLLNYVAERQRQVLKRRITTKDTPSK